MRTYGQYCPIARGAEIFAERWTPLIIRNLHLGCETFGEILDGAPGLSRTLLAQRLKQLERVGIVVSAPKPHRRGQRYQLTRSGHDLFKVSETLGEWGARWLEIAPENPQEVRLTLEIQAKVPIKQDTVAILSVQGLTGVAFVDLTGGSAGSPPLTAKAGETYPVIKSGPSLFVRLDKAVSEMLTNVNALAKDAHELLNSNTRESIEQTLRHIATLTAEVARHQNSLGSALDSAAKTMQNTAKASAALPKLVEQVHQSVIALDGMARNISATSEAVRGAVKSSSGELQTFGRQTLPQVNQLLNQLQQLTGSLQQLTRKLQEHPQGLIYGNQPAQFALAQGFVRLLALGDVVAHTKHFDNLPVLIADRRVGPCDPDPLPVPAHVLVDITAVSARAQRDLLYHERKVAPRALKQAPVPVGPADPPLVFEHADRPGAPP